MHEITSFRFYDEAHLPGFYNLFLAYSGPSVRVIDVCIWNSSVFCLYDVSLRHF